MGNLFINLPAPVGSGPGAWVDMSAFGPTKTITVVETGATLPSFVTVECSNQAVPTKGFPLRTFSQPGEGTFDVACHWMRINVSNFRGGAPVVNVGGTDSGTSFAQVPVPPGQGVGAGVDVSALPLFKTVQVAGPFRGTVIIEISEDGGVTFSQAFSFSNQPGAQTQVIAADFMRVSRSNAPNVVSGTPTVWVAATLPPGGGAIAVTGPAGAIAYFDATGHLAGDVPNLSYDPINKVAFADNLFVGTPAVALSKLFVNQAVTDHGSSADVQISSLTANACQVRSNQYGANTGIPGISTFKSRATAIGGSASVLVGDVLFRATAVGVCGDNVSIPLSGLISIVVDQVGTNFLGTSFDIQLVPPTGPINGRKQAFRVDGNGLLHLTESLNKSAGVAVLDGTGTAVIPNTSVSATTKFQLTAQDTGPAPTGSPYQSARVVGTSFTIKSTGGAADTGVNVYYTLFEPTVP